MNLAFDRFECATEEINRELGRCRRHKKLTTARNTPALNARLGDNVGGGLGLGVQLHQQLHRLGREVLQISVAFDRDSLQ